MYVTVRSVRYTIYNVRVGGSTYGVRVPVGSMIGTFKTPRPFFTPSTTSNIF